MRHGGWLRRRSDGAFEENDRNVPELSFGFRFARSGRAVRAAVAMLLRGQTVQLARRFSVDGQLAMWVNIEREIAAAAFSPSDRLVADISRLGGELFVSSGST